MPQYRHRTRLTRMPSQKKILLRPLSQERSKRQERKNRGSSQTRVQSLAASACSWCHARAETWETQKHAECYKKWHSHNKAMRQTDPFKPTGLPVLRTNEQGCDVCMYDAHDQCPSALASVFNLKSIDKATWSGFSTAAKHGIADPLQAHVEIGSLREYHAEQMMRLLLRHCSIYMSMEQCTPTSMHARPPRPEYQARHCTVPRQLPQLIFPTSASLQYSRWQPIRLHSY